MSRMELAVVGLGLAVVCGCNPSCCSKPKPASAFRAADAVVAVNWAGVASKSEQHGLKIAAAELTNMLFKVTGAPIAICDEGKVPPDAKAVIYLGATEAARDAHVTGEGLRNGDWRIKTVPGKAFLYGKTSYAVIGAVSDFGERFCDYHVVFADGRDVCSENSTLVIPLVDRTVKPVIYGRRIYTAMMDGVRYPVTKRDWERYERMRLGDTPSSIEGRYRVSRQTKTDCHSQFDYIPPEKYFKDHPEYYCLTPGGQRRAIANAQSQICYTNPDTYRIVLESLRRFVAADRKANPKDPPLVYDFTHLDNCSYLCCCPDCKKVIAKYNRKPGGHEEGGDAGLQLEFVNRLARDIRKDYPDVIIRTFAYVSTECAPKPGTIRPEPNVRIWWCDVYSHSDHTIPLETPGHFNARQAEELREWTALTDNIEVWDYMLYHLPEISPDALKADAELFARSGISLVMMETEYHGQPFYELNYYLNSRLYVDPTLEIDPLLRIYSRGFGRGADDMYAALQYLRGCMNALHSKTKDEWHSRAVGWLEPPVMERLGEMLKGVYAKETSPVVRGRVTRMLAGVYRQLITGYKKDPKAKAELDRSVEAFRRYGLESAQLSFMEPKNRAAAKASVETTIELLTLQFKDLPEELRSVPSDELVCVDYHIRRDGKRVVDSASERGYSIEATGARLPMACGIYDEQSKDSFGTKIPVDAVPNDGKYHWVRLRKCHIGRCSIFWFPGSWQCSFWLRDQHIIADGMAVDPNWYVLWASVRFDGTSTFVDRLAFRRVKP